MLVPNYLIIAATNAEVQPFAKHYKKNKNILYKDVKIEILITGVGLMAATYSITNYSNNHYKPAVIIMIGIAGCYNSKVKLGEVFAIKSEVVADMGVQENNTWYDMCDLHFIPPNDEPYTNGKLINSNKTMLHLCNVPVVNAVTVNQITTDNAIIKMYKTKYLPQLESMEGAALHYSCLQKNIPFVQLRGVSNYIGERDKSKWNITQAITNVNNVAISFLSKLLLTNNNNAIPTH